MTHDFKINDTVRILDSHTRTPDTGRFTGVATVVKVNAVNLKINLNGVLVTVSPELLIHVDEQPVNVDDMITVADVGKLAYVRGGSGSKWTYGPNTLFVIMNVHDRIKVVKLGGDGGRTWTVPRHHVTVAPLESLNIAVSRNA
jgi:hypothetical protein